MTRSSRPWPAATLADGIRNDGTMAVISGAGSPVVLVHGMGLNLAMWRGQLAPLEQQFKVVRYDLLGHGASQARPGPYVLADFVDQLARLLDGLEIERCHLVGFSLGGLIAQAFTLDHPLRVDRLAVLNTGFDRDDGERAGMIERLRIAWEDGHAATVETALARWFTAEFTKCQPNLIDQVRGWMHANDPAVYPEVYRVLVYGDRALAAELPAIRCPALVLTCAGDSGSPPAMAQRMARAIPHAHLAIVPDLKHMGLLEDPPAINDILLPFLVG